MAEYKPSAKKKVKPMCYFSDLGRCYFSDMGRCYFSDMGRCYFSEEWVSS